MKTVTIFNKQYTYTVESNYIEVNNKKMKLKHYKNSGIVFKLNKTCVSTTSSEHLLNFINSSIEDQFSLSLVKKIFEFIIERGE